LKYRLAFKPRVRKDLKALPHEQMRRVLEKIEAMTDELAGDVKKLTHRTSEYRLRVGEGDTIVVYRVVHRREAYR
jgi:mRNA interferase RelE/StbE